MTAKETVQTWRWRIVRSGHNAASFSKILGIAPSLMSEYLSGVKTPSLGRFDEIEEKLKDLEG